MAGEITPNVTRSGSVMPNRTYVGERTQGSLVSIPWHGAVTAGRAGSIPRPPSAADLRRLVPRGYRFVRATATAILVEKIDGPKPTYGPTVNESEIFAKEQEEDSRWNELDSAPRRAAWAQRIADTVRNDSISMNGVIANLGDEPGAALQERNGQIQAIQAGMGDLGSAAESEIPFIMSYGSVVDPLTLARTGVQNARGNYMSADSMDRAMAAGSLDPGNLESGKNTNYMSLGAGLAWLRKLSVTDKAAYNHMVVLLRNANYGNLPDEDKALPLNGWDRRVAQAFLEAAGDLAQANDAGDERDLIPFLEDRGKGYADLLAQQEAEKHAPVDREYQDPATIAAAAREEAKRVLGRKLTDAEEAQLQGHFRGLEDAFYDKADAAKASDGSFSGYRPDTTGQVDDFLQGDEYTTERQQRLVGQYAQEFMRMMGVSS